MGEFRRKFRNIDNGGAPEIALRPIVEVLPQGSYRSDAQGFCSFIWIVWAPEIAQRGRVKAKEHGELIVRQDTTDALQQGIPDSYDSPARDFHCSFRVQTHLIELESDAQLKGVLHVVNRSSPSTCVYPRWEFVSLIVLQAALKRGSARRRHVVHSGKSLLHMGKLEVHGSTHPS